MCGDRHRGEKEHDDDAPDATRVDPREREAQRMEALERAIMAEMGFDDPYTVKQREPADTDEQQVSDRVDSAGSECDE